jgi:hypothetical protein
MMQTTTSLDSTFEMRPSVELTDRGPRDSGVLAPMPWADVIRSLLSGTGGRAEIRWSSFDLNIPLRVALGLALLVG